MNRQIDTYEIYLQQLFRTDPNATVLVNSAKGLLPPSATLADFNMQILSIYSSKQPVLPEHSSEELSSNLSDILKFALSQMEEEIQHVEVAGEGEGAGAGAGEDEESEEGEEEDDISARLQKVSLEEKPKPLDVDELVEQMKQITIEEGPEGTEGTELEESSIDSEDEEELRGIVKNDNYYADKILMLLLTNEWPQSRLTEEDLDFKPICSETAKKSMKIIKQFQYKLIDIQNYILNEEITAKTKQESTSNNLITYLKESCPEDFPLEKNTLLFLQFLEDVLSLNSRRYSISSTKIGSGMTFEVPLDAEFGTSELTTQNVLSYNKGGQEYKLLSGEYFILHFDKTKTNKPVKILKEVELGKNNFEITGLICGNDVYIYTEDGWGKYNGTEEISVIRWREIPKDNVDFACYSIIEESEEEESEVSDESEESESEESDSEESESEFRKKK